MRKVVITSYSIHYTKLYEQFVRDFKQFMGMTPSQYAALDKPIMAAVMRERDRYSRDFVRTLRKQGDDREYGVKT